VRIGSRGDPTARAPTLGELRAFVAVAEELHFARAAQRLGIAPPPLSQTIRRLEEKLGVALLVRTPRTVVLTEAGAELLPRARDILARMDAAQSAVSARATGGRGTIVVGIASNGFAEMTPAIIEAFRAANPRASVMLRDITTDWIPHPVISEAVDVALIRPPTPEEQDPRLRVEHVVAEPRVALLPAGHRMADAESISMSDLEDERFVAVGPEYPEIVDFWAGVDARDGVRPRLGAEARSVPEVLQAVAYLGDVITSIPSVLRFFRVPGIAAVPLRDVSPATMAVCVRLDEQRPLVGGFVDAVHEVSARAPDLVPTAFPTWSMEATPA
jgi:LysR family transcriptional regulator, benzoate and cis,cis-muconate-responsive activator of ben and cat genes